MLIGDTAKTVDALIKSITEDPANKLINAAFAALQAIRCVHVPNLQDAIVELNTTNNADSSSAYLH